MTLTLVPVDMPALWAFLRAKNWSVSQANYRAVVREVASGAVWAAEMDGRTLALGAITVIDDGPGDGVGIAWLSVADGGAGGNGIALVRGIRRALAAMEVRHAQTVIAIVDDANTNGQRLARLVGFTPTERVTLGGMRTWTYGRCANRGDGEKAVQPRQGSAGAPGGAAG